MRRQVLPLAVVLLQLLTVMQGQVSFAEETPPGADTTARPVNSGSSVAPVPTGAPLPGKPISAPPIEPCPAPPSEKQVIKSRFKSCFFPLRHPKKAFSKMVFPVVHPLQFGKICENNGTNGLLGFLGGCANVGTTCILGARKF